MRTRDLLIELGAPAPSPFVRLVEQFFEPQECVAVRERIDALGPAAAPVTTHRGAVMRPDLRNNDRVMFDDAELATSLFARAQGLLPATLRGKPNTMAVEGPTWHLAGLNERFRGYRYRPGQRFAPHVDGSFARSPDEQSAITFLVYLDEGCLGGSTRLLDWNLSIEPTLGALLMFDHGLRHEGALVERGEKTVLRSDVMYARER